MYRFFGHPPIPSHHHHHHHYHHDKRLLPKPRYRHGQPFMSHMGIKYHHKDRDITNIGGHQGFSNIIDKVLNLHNNYRARHCAPPLEINNDLNKIAQSYAERLARTSSFQHSGNTFEGQPLGENLYMAMGTPGLFKDIGDQATKGWYDEIRSYNYNKPGFSPATGHFTQLIWKSTEMMGVGVAFSRDGSKVYVVANYFPAGNVSNPGYFQKNVLPANCSSKSLIQFKNKNWNRRL